MRSTCRQNEAEFSRLQTRYRAAWSCFSVAVCHWLTLQAEEQQDLASLREAETAAHAAEEQYRRARNAFADYLLERSCHYHESLLVSSR
jgi:uncharacterized protein YacL (UPF0231 family)